MYPIEFLLWALFGLLLAILQSTLFSTVSRNHRIVVGVVTALLGGLATRAALPQSADPFLSLLAAGVTGMVGLMLLELVGRARTRPF